MFESIYINPVQRTTVEKNVVVKEQRAPTDDSVRLLKEFEEKAEKKLYDAFYVKNNVFECQVFVYNDACDLSTKIRIKMLLNGQENNIQHSISQYDKNLKSPDELIDDIIKCVSEIITGKIIEILVNNKFARNNLFK